MMARNQFAELKDRQKHADDNATHHHTEEDDQDGFDQRGQTRQGCFDFLVQEIGHAFEHGVDFARLLPGGHHADDHGGENGVFAQGGGDALAALDVGGGGFDGG